MAVSTHLVKHKMYQYVYNHSLSTACDVPRSFWQMHSCMTCHILQSTAVRQGLLWGHRSAVVLCHSSSMTSCTHTMCQILLECAKVTSSGRLFGQHNITIICTIHYHLCSVTTKPAQSLEIAAESITQDRVYQKPVSNVNDLKQHLIKQVVRNRVSFTDQAAEIVLMRHSQKQTQYLWWCESR